MDSKRNIGVDILKFLAAFLVFNSHADILYGKYDYLATGGAIGKALFFFCSAFTLFLKPMTGLKGFPDWYKRRINRIYPTIFAFAIICCLFFNRHYDIIYLILHGGGWFITGIMMYYVPIYFIGSYGRKHSLHLLAAWCAGLFLLFFMMDRPADMDIFVLRKSENLTWLVYFTFMLLGAIMGNNQQIASRNGLLNAVLTVVSITLFYALVWTSKTQQNMAWVQMLCMLPLMSAVYFAYHMCNSGTAKRLYQNKWCYRVIRFVGGLCLEIYLIQFNLITIFGNNDISRIIFPLNVVVSFIMIVLAAYLMRCLARLIKQTFSDEPYSWHEIVSPY
ncbi:MAG: acyltransferase [Muribaculaceae bacterium]|nr:acyltransferase [Muribaculaceae bacterium]